MPTISKREKQVMELLAEGLKSKEVAERLFISDKTVRNHVSNAMGKLGAGSRGHALAILMGSGEIKLKEAPKA